MDPQQLQALQAKHAEAMRGPIPHYYCNSFINSLTSADIAIVFEQNGQPSFTLNISYTTAKSLSVKLGALVASLEGAWGHPILTSDEINKMVPKITEIAKSKE